MATIISLDDYRHKLVDKILIAGTYEQIKRFLLVAIKSMKEREVHGHLINRFIDKTINQLYAISLLDQDLKRQLNIKYAKSQLELIKRHEEEGKKHV